MNAEEGKDLPPLPYLLGGVDGGSGSIVPRSPRNAEVTAAPRATRSFVAVTAVECGSNRTKREASGDGVVKVHSSALAGCDWRWARVTRVARESEQLSCASGAWQSGATQNVQLHEQTETRKEKSVAEVKESTGLGRTRNPGMWPSRDKRSRR